MIKIRKHYPFINRVTVVGLLAAVGSLILPIIGLVYVLYWLTKLMSNKSLAEGFVIALLVFFVGNGLIYEVLNFIHIFPDIRLVSFVYAIVALLFLGKANTPKKPVPLISNRIVISLVASLLGFALMVSPVIINHSYQGSNYTIAAFHLLTNGEDNASHYALFKYDFLHNGYSYSLNTNGHGLITTLVNYPQGSEFTFSWLTRVVVGNVHITDNLLLKSFFILTSFYFCLLIFLITLLSLVIFEKLSNFRSNFVVGTITIITVTSLATLGPLLFLMGRGFQSEVFAYIYLLGILYSLILYKKLPFKALILATIMFAGVCISWWFLAPIAFMPLVIFLFVNRRIILGKKLLLLILVWVLALSTYPIIISYLSNSQTSSLNEPGGVDPISWLAYTLYILGFCLVLYRLIRRVASPLILAFAAWVLFTLLVAIYQKFTVGHLEYYFYKSLYTLVPLSTVVIACVVALIAIKFTIRLPFYNRVVVSISMVIVFALGWFLINPVYPRVYMHDWFNNLITPAELGVLLENSDSNKLKDFLYIGGCNIGERYIMNRWADAMFLSDNRWEGKFVLDSLYGYGNENIIPILQSIPYPKNKVYIYINSQCYTNSLNYKLVTDGFLTN